MFVCVCVCCFFVVVGFGVVVFLFWCVWMWQCVCLVLVVLEFCFVVCLVGWFRLFGFLGVFFNVFCLVRLFVFPSNLFSSTYIFCMYEVNARLVPVCSTSKVARTTRTADTQINVS